MAETAQHRGGSLTETSPTDKLLFFSKFASLVSGTIGIAILIAWHQHWSAFLQLHPRLPPMQYNTAIGFLLCGAGLAFVQSRHLHASRWCAGLLVLLGLLTLGEYGTGLNLGIDELFFKAYIQVATAYPGRMAPLSAACFAILGVAIGLISCPDPSKIRPLVASMLGCVTTVIAALTIGGYSWGIEEAVGWGAYSLMALHTAILFLLLGVGIVTWTIHILRGEIMKLFRWLLVAAAFTLLTMVGFLSVLGFTQLHSSTTLRNHSSDVLLASQSLMVSITKVQRNARAFTLTKDPASLISYQSYLDNTAKQLALLDSLTKDNSLQQHNLAMITDDLNRVESYTQQTITLFNEKGLEAVTQLGLTGQGLRASNAFLDDLLNFTETEKALLRDRSAKVDAEFINTEHLLIFGGSLALLLLALANLMANQEISYRRQIESKLAERTMELEKMTEILNDRNIELENAATAKDRFISNMSHELRTPLNGIIGFSEILVDGLPGEINDKQKDCLENILSCGQHLLQLINDVLDLAKLGAGKMEVHPELFSLETTIMGICSVVNPLVKKKQITVTRSLEPGLDSVTLDHQKFKQILYNLLSNAIKFTHEHGQIDITVTRQNNDYFSMAVKDTGIGIQPADLKRLFKEFEQVDSSVTRSYQGTGLGLALTRKIVEIQGGKIQVESTVGVGSTFIVTLPLTLKELPHPAT